MALVPNYFPDPTIIEIPKDAQDDWTEGLKTVTIRCGYYRAPNQGTSKGRSTAGDDSILLEKETSIQNQNSTEIRKDDEEWEYDIVNGPPLSYQRVTESNVYLPGLGRNMRKCEEEKIEYFTFSPLTDGDNLGRIRRISALVVYTLPVDPTKAASAESKTKAAEADVEPGDTEDRIVSTGKLWSEANYDGTIIPNDDAPQCTKWIKNVIEEHDIIEEQPDRWIKWTITKNALRPGDVKVSGPHDIKKTGVYYQFPYPIDPPKIDLDELAGGNVRVKIDGGGATWTTPWFRKEISIPADKYNVYRKKVSEPERDVDDDIYDRWDTAPTPEPSRMIVTNTTVEDFDGVPADPIPSPTSYTEPHDVDPPEEPYETAFSLIGTVDNEHIDRRALLGYGELIDDDVVATAEYEYYATAIISETESPDSNHETITVGTDGLHRMRMRNFDDGRGADVLPPDDPSIPGDDFGEVVELEVPTEDIEEVIDEIAERQFATNEPDYTVALEVLYPLLGLEYGQTVVAPIVQWDAHGNDTHMATETEDNEWTLVGFTLKVEKNKDGSWRSQRTMLSLQEFPR